MKNEYEMTVDDELTAERIAELENELREIELDERSARFLDSLDRGEE